MKRKIKNEEAGIRLDKFITNEIPGINRSQIKKNIEAGDVLVNKVPGKASYKIKENDVVYFKFIDRSLTKEEKEDRVKIDKPKKSVINKIKIVEETDDYLVVNKPAGLIVHGEEYIEEYSLADWLLAKFPDLKGVGEDVYRPGIVHRLDKEASGLMVVAKNDNSYKSLKKQFQKRTIKKKYKALVFGSLSKDYDEINFPIKRSNSGNKQAAVPASFNEDKTVRDAITIFEVEKRFINYTLLDITIKTGRKHQIRVHMYAYGHSIVGDNLYNTKKTKEANSKNGLNRIFLVAYYLSFKNLSGEVCDYKISLPRELSAFLKIVK